MSFLINETIHNIYKRTVYFFTRDFTTMSTENKQTNIKTNNPPKSKYHVKSNDSPIFS